jgi:hypothetical protein
MSYAGPTVVAVGKSLHTSARMQEGGGGDGGILWITGGDVSQAEPGTSAKGHLADGTFVSISISTLLR